MYSTEYKNCFDFIPRLALMSTPSDNGVDIVRFKPIQILIFTV